MDMEASSSKEVGGNSSLATVSGSPVSTSDPCELIIGALNELLEDKVLTLPTPHATRTRQSATSVLEWCSNSHNCDKFRSFAAHLVYQLTTCVPQVKGVQKVEREKMWGTYHQLRTTTDFCRAWKELIFEATGSEASPIFFQRLTDIIFRRLLQYLYTFTVPKETQISPLSYEEMNGLRCAAGYVPRALKKRIMKSSHALKDDLVLCLQDLVQEDQSCTDESEEWVTLLDRGGLNYVTNNMYSLLVEMEYELRLLLKGTTLEKFKTVASTRILQNEKVRHYWEIISENWDVEEGEVLLNMIIELWVTMRGFSFASSWVEMYKIAHKKSVQTKEKSYSNSY